MKKTLLLLSIIVFIGCEKKQCADTMTVLSNERQAKLKCVGLANNYPQMDTVLSVKIECSEPSTVKTVSSWCGFETMEVTIIN